MLFILESEVRMKRSKMDKGIRIGSWGQLQGWYRLWMTVMKLILLR